jgi:hypothetical protein
MSNYIIKSVLAIGGCGALYTINRGFTKSRLSNQHFNEIDAIQVRKEYDDLDRYYDEATYITIIGVDGNELEMRARFYQELNIDDGPKKVYYSDDLQYAALSKDVIVKWQMKDNSFF